MFAADKNWTPTTSEFTAFHARSGHELDADLLNAFDVEKASQWQSSAMF
jgi:hypothetical protein